MGPVSFWNMHPPAEILGEFVCCHSVDLSMFSLHSAGLATSDSFCVCALDSYFDTLPLAVVGASIQ